MSEVSEVINHLVAQILSSQDFHHEIRTTNYCISPSALYSTLCIMSQCLDSKASKVTQQLLNIDFDSVFQEMDASNEFIFTSPRSAIKDTFTEWMSHTRMYFLEENEISCVDDRLLSLFDVSIEKVEQEQIINIGEKVNEWLRSTTNSKDLIYLPLSTPLDNVDGCLYISNALSFSASWKHPFNPLKAELKPFYVQSQDSVEMIHMMRVRAYIRVGIDKDLNASIIELPFKNPYISSLIIIPDKSSNLELLLSNFNNLTFDDWISFLQYQETVVYLPKISLNTNSSLMKTLISLGIPVKSDPECSNQENPKTYRLTDYLQAASFSVNEVGISVHSTGEHSFRVKKKPVTSRSGIVPTYKANRPFIFIIYDSQLRVPLLVSIISSPSKRF